MTTTAPRALYEYRGNRPEVVQLPTEPIVIALARSKPMCGQCGDSTVRVASGWWCSSCETAAG